MSELDYKVEWLEKRLVNVLHKFAKITKVFFKEKDGRIKI